MTTMPAAGPHPRPAKWGHRLLHWAPRILALLFILFLGVFALDMFGMGLSPWEAIAGFLMHLVPNFILLAIVLLAWRWPWVGGAGFLGWSLWYSFAFQGFDYFTFALFAGIPALIGLLYLADWYVHRQIRA